MTRVTRTGRGTDRNAWSHGQRGNRSVNPYSTVFPYAADAKIIFEEQPFRKTFAGAQLPKQLPIPRDVVNKTHCLVCR